MSKSIKNIYDEKLNYINLLNAYNRAIKNKREKREILKFGVDLETNLIGILNELKTGKYKIGKYKTFIIYEPKMRKIMSLPFKDRIVQQWYIAEFIKPFICSRFISDTYACINERGTHKAVYKVQKYMRAMKRKYGSYYVLKCDISKYFYTVDRDILYNILKSFIKDKKLLKLTHLFVYDDDAKKGIPIGNYTSQYFANIYLNGFDHYVKEILKVKYYVRYMDDFVLLLKDKEECKKMKEKIEIYLNSNLKLKLNNKTNYYPNKMGVNFCGFRIFETHRLLRIRCKAKIKKNVLLWNKLYDEDRLNSKKFELSWNSYLGHSRHANSYNFNKKMIENIKIINLND